MAAAVKIDFRIAGIDEVRKALDTITGRAQRVAVAGVRAQTQAAEQGAKATRKATAQALSDMDAKAAAEVALIRKVNRLRVEAAKSAVTLEKQLADEIARASSEKERAALKDKASREQARQDRQKERADIRATTAELTRQKREAAAAERTQKRDAATAMREQAARASNRRQMAGDVASGAAGGFKAGVAIVGGVAGVTAASAVRQQMALDERAALLSNASGKSTREFDSVSKAKALSNLTGVSADEVMGGFEKLSGKAGGGGLTEYTEQFSELAKIARGAGVSMTDLGDTLGTLYNRGVKSKDVVKVVEALVQQGKDGAVEFNQLAVLLDASSGSLGKFKMGDAERVMTAGGLSQFARTFGKKSAEESTNAVEDLARDLGGKADVIQRLTGGSATTVHTKGKKTKKLVNGRMVETTEGDSTKTTFAGGVEVGTDGTRAQLRDINKLLPEIIEGVVKTGNAGKLMGEGGIFTGNATAIAGPLLQAFTEGIKRDKEGRFQLRKDGETADLSGRAAVEAMLTQFQSATVAEGTSEKAFQNVMASPQAKMNQQIETLRNELGAKLAPLAAKAVENPKTAAAAVIGGMTVAGGANALLGKAGGALLDKLFPKSVANMSVTAANVVVGGAGVPGVPTPTGATGSAASTAAKGGGLAALGGGLTIAAAQGYMYYKAGQAIQGEAKDLAGTAGASELAAKVAGGKGTAEDRERAAVQARRYELQSGGFVDRVAAGFLGMGDKVAQEGVSVGSVGRMLAGAPSAFMAAAQGGDPASTANAKGAAEELRAALTSSPMKLEPGSQVTITNADALAAPIVAAIGAAGLQQPKAQAP